LNGTLNGTLNGASVGDGPAVVEIGGGSPGVHQTGWAVVEKNNKPGEPTISAKIFSELRSTLIIPNMGFYFPIFAAGEQ
jgi:hypothetical protein